MRTLTLTIFFTLSVIALSLNADPITESENSSLNADCTEKAPPQNLLAMFQRPDDLEDEECGLRCEEKYEACKSDDSQNPETCTQKKYDCLKSCG